MKQIFLLMFVFLVFKYSHSQTRHHILLGTDIPLQYAIGYEFKPVRWLGFQAKLGVLTTPYDKAILSIMETLGTDSKLVNMIEGAFQFGTLGTVVVNFHFNKWYGGLQAQYISLNASSVPTNLVASYYGYDFSPSPLVSNVISTPKVKITLNSNLLQSGFTIGRRVSVLPWAEARFELGFAKNFWSGSNVDVNSVSGTVFGLQYSEKYLEDQLDSELNSTYKKYAYTPTFNAYWVFKF